MTDPRVVILGAGPAGLGATYRLVRRGFPRVTVLERNSRVGGNAGSFQIAGQFVDYGSHRLHPSCDAGVMNDIRGLLGDDLLDRPRHGRIRLKGRWVHFPLKPADLALRLPLGFSGGVFLDLVSRPFRSSRQPRGESFATVLERGLGRTICQDFYFPYARKVWGLPPEHLSAGQARRRVSASSLGRMSRKILSTVPALKPKGAGRFFYPRRGFGQISQAYCEEAEQEGAEIILGATVQSVDTEEGVVKGVGYERNGRLEWLAADAVWSTIPVTVLARSIQPSPPPDLIAAADGLDYRAMVLVYLVLGQDRFTEYDAHYFPEEEIRITRLSEPKNYGDGQGSPGTTVLCAELPCSPGDPEWRMTDEELQEIVETSLERAGIPITAPVQQVATRRLPQAYPIYPIGYQAHFDRLDGWLAGIRGLLTFGRQGLFAHDNTHHALYMAYSAASCLDDCGGFDSDRWQAYRHVFETHVVED